MGSGFYKHERATGGFCRVWRDEEGASFNRAEQLIPLTHSKCLLMAIQKWIGEGFNPTIKSHLIETSFDKF